MGRALAPQCGAPWIRRTAICERAPARMSTSRFGGPAPIMQGDAAAHWGGGGDCQKPDGIARTLIHGNAGSWGCARKVDAARTQ